MNQLLIATSADESVAISATSLIIDTDSDTKFHFLLFASQLSFSSSFFVLRN
jgi:hypothetical protein